MRRVALLVVLPAALCAQPRIARVSELEGKVEIRRPGVEAWREAVRHLPVLEGARLLANASSRLEIELDESSVLRLAADSEAELSDYTRLSTGQRITHLALDRGVAYFSGEQGRRDAIVLSVAGVQASLTRGSPAPYRPSWLKLSRSAMMASAYFFQSTPYGGFARM